MMRCAKQVALAAALAGLVGCGGPASDAGANASAAKNFDNTVYYTGQGLNSNPDGFGGYDLNQELCGLANGAEADGPYLLWVLTATKATTASITGPWGTAAMSASGNGTFKYVSGWYDPDALLPEVVSATYDGKATNAQLVISHGCRPYKQGAWCSPGFWRNARPGAWSLIGADPATATFNGYVSTAFYGANLDPDQLLTTVLNAPQTYSGAPVQGDAVACALNAFNATGAYLTSLISGYQFDCTVMQDGGSDACPIDNFGNFKR